MKTNCKIKRYTLHCLQDVEPVLHGPFATERQRTNKARRLRQKHPEDSLYRLDIRNGKPVVDFFCGAELEDKPK